MPRKNSRASGRSRVGDGVKVLRGTYRKDRASSEGPRIEPGLPEPPAWLDKNALEVWQRVGAELIEAGIITPIDGPVFACFCQAVSDVERLTKAVRREGEVITTATGAKKRNPRSILLREARELVSKLAPAFGCEPFSRPRIKPIKPTAKDDPWDKFW